jgi:hypothetical protein
VREPHGEAGKCGFVKEQFVAVKTNGLPGSAVSMSFSTDPKQTCLYVGDNSNMTIYVLNRDTLQELGRLGRSGAKSANSTGCIRSASIPREHLHGRGRHGKAHPEIHTVRSRWMQRHGPDDCGRRAAIASDIPEGSTETRPLAIPRVRKHARFRVKPLAYAVQFALGAVRQRPSAFADFELNLDER